METLLLVRCQAEAASCVPFSEGIGVAGPVDAIASG